MMRTRHTRGRQSTRGHGREYARTSMVLSPPVWRISSTKLSVGRFRWSLIWCDVPKLFEAKRSDRIFASSAFTCLLLQDFSSLFCRLVRPSIRQSVPTPFFGLSALVRPCQILFWALKPPHSLPTFSRRRLENLPTNIRLGMMRHTFVVIDMSKSMGEQDLKPTRFKCCLKLLQKFIDEYFDQNPIR